MLTKRYFQSIGEKVMSLTHIRLSRILDDNDNVSYKVESTDFTDDDAWFELGILHISKTAKKYQFVGSQLAKENKLIPPELYGLSPSKKQQLLHDKYSNYGWGAWSMCIHHWATTLIRDSDYPNQYPR